MSLESRSRMISFRLTDEEYERFRRLCVARGLRSVSELVRTAVNQMLGSPHDGTAKPDPEIHLRVERLESQMTDLAIAVEEVERRIDDGRHAQAANS